MKLDKLKILKGDEKTIGNEFEINLKPYTVLIGENNSGKTNIVNAFYEQSKKEYNIIYFSAINIELEKSDEASASKKTSPFYKLLAEILKKEKLNLNEDIIKPINDKLTEVTNKINKEIQFIKNKETSLKVLETLSEEAVIKNLIPLKILDKYWKETREVKPGDIGQGTQRMIIFSLLKYYSEQDENNKKLNFFIIEEPEVYLHPQLKQEFNKILFEISKKENNQVLITTHDPYFVEINTNERENKAVITIKRNEKTGFTEQADIRPMFLPDVSHGEINYRVFGVCSDSFHNELYGYLQEKYEKYNENDIESFFLENDLEKDKTWVKEKDGIVLSSKLVTLQTFIRNKIHHPENKTMKDNKFTPEELKKSIDKMINLI